MRLHVCLFSSKSKSEFRSGIFKNGIKKSFKGYCPEKPCQQHVRMFALPRQCKTLKLHVQEVPVILKSGHSV